MRFKLAIIMIIALSWYLPAQAAQPLPPPKTNQVIGKLSKHLGNSNLPDWGVLVCTPFDNSGYLKDHLLCGIKTDPDMFKTKTAWASLEYLYKLRWRLIAVMPGTGGSDEGTHINRPVYYLEKQKP